MPARNPKSVLSNLWPDLEYSYNDEYGRIDPDVYELAAKLWPLAVSLIRRTIKDLETGQGLMLKAVALVSRKLDEQPEKMTNLQAYLFRTFKNLVSEQLEASIKHGQLNHAAVAQSRAITEGSEDDIYEMILLHEVLQRADQWTREVSELRILGHTFEEIGARYGMKSNYASSKWSKRVNELTEKIRQETAAAERKILRKRRGEL